MQQPPTKHPSEGAGGATSELRSDAQQLGSKAANRLHSEVDSRKGTAVTQVQSVSSAISQAADGLDEQSPAWLKSAFQQGAQKIQQFADTIDQKDSRQLMREAQDFARNNPGTFLAACAAAGFAAARVLKAGADQQAATPPQGDNDQQIRPERPFVAAQQAGSAPQSSAQFGQDDPTSGSFASGSGGSASSRGEFV